MCHNARTVHALLFLILGARLLGGRVRCRVCSQRGKTAPVRPPCPCRARDAQQCTSACCLVFLRSRPPVPCRVRWVRCVWVWGWGLIARFACVWSFLLPVPAPVRGLCRGYSTLSILHILDLTPLYLGHSHVHVLHKAKPTFTLVPLL